MASATPRRATFLWVLLFLLVASLRTACETPGSPELEGSFRSDGSLPPSLNEEGSVHSQVSSADSEGFAVVVDAGSTGSRVYVYKYKFLSPSRRQSQREPRLQIFLPAFATKRVSPGVAAFAEETLAKGSAAAEEEVAFEERPEQTQGGKKEFSASGERFHSEGSPCKSFALYMRRLREAVWEAIPLEEDRRRAFLFFRGTAGVRALPEPQRKALLEAVQLALDSWGLRAFGEKSVGVLTGKEEGVLGWLALNQLLGTFPPKLQFAKFEDSSSTGVASSQSDSLTAALIEMGGASAQVVFEIPHQMLETLSVQKGAASARGDPSAAASSAETLDEQESFLAAVDGHPELGVLRLGDEEILLFAKSFHGFGRRRA